MLPNYNYQFCFVLFCFHHLSSLRCPEDPGSFSFAAFSSAAFHPKCICVTPSANHWTNSVLCTKMLTDPFHVCVCLFLLSDVSASGPPSHQQNVGHLDRTCNHWCSAVVAVNFKTYSKMNCKDLCGFLCPQQSAIATLTPDRIISDFPMIQLYEQAQSYIHIQINT